MKAPISRVLPTPVASAKQSEGNSRSKSVTVENSLRIAASAASRSTPFLGGAISVTRSRISSERRCGARKLKRPVMALTWRFMVSVPAQATAIVDVWCFSNLEKVELLLNWKSLGVQAMERNSHVAWKVKYAPGTLEARGYRGDRLV